MAADVVFEVRNTVWRQRAGAGVLVVVGVLVTGIWVWTAGYDPDLWREPALILCGPVILVIGGWLLRFPYAVRVRLRLDAEGIFAWVGRRDDPPVWMSWEALEGISSRTSGTRGRFLDFEGDGRTIRLNAHALDVRREEIVRRVALVIETMCKRLERENVSGLSKAVRHWRVVEGAAY